MSNNNFPDIQVEVTEDDTEACFRLIIGPHAYELHATQMVELQAKINEAMLAWFASSSELMLRMVQMLREGT